MEQQRAVNVFVDTKQVMYHVTYINCHKLSQTNTKTCWQKHPHMVWSISAYQLHNLYMTENDHIDKMLNMHQCYEGSLLYYLQSLLHICHQYLTTIKHQQDSTH